MTEHTPEAQAAYPDPPRNTGGVAAAMVRRERTAFDLGRSAYRGDKTPTEVAADLLDALRDEAIRYRQEDGVLSLEIDIDQDGWVEVVTAALEGFDGFLRASMVETVTTAVKLLGELVDPDPCEWDHNHSCQAHGHYYIPQGEKCPVQNAKDFIASFRPDREEGKDA